MNKIIKSQSQKLRLFFLFGIALLFAAQANATSADSLKQIWINSAQPDSIRYKAIFSYYEKYAYAQPDSVLELTAYHLDLAQEKDSKDEMSTALNYRTLVLCVKGEFDDALVEMNKRIEILSSLDDELGLARSYTNIGSIYYYQHKYQEAIRYYSKSLDYFQKQKYEFTQAEIFNNLGLVYYEINHFELALDYFNRALGLYKKTEMEDKRGNVWLHIGKVDLEQKNYQQAITNSQKAVKIFKANNDQFSLANCYALNAKAYRALNQIDTALFYAKKSLEIDESIGSKDQTLGAKLLIADLILETNLKEATKIGEEVLGKIEDAPGQSMKVDVYKLLYKCYKKKGNYPLALAMHENYITAYDSLLIENNDIAVIREAIQTEYEIKLFDNQIENEQAQSQLKLNQLKKTFAILLASLITILLTIFYTRAKRNSYRKQKEDLLDEIQKLKSAGNTSLNLSPQGFQLNRAKIEESIGRKVNETDWKVLNILSDDPVISNKDIAQKAFLTVDGIGSCLRRMYIAFDVKESKYKKISLIMKAIKLSNN